MTAAMVRQPQIANSELHTDLHTAIKRALEEKIKGL